MPTITVPRLCTRCVGRRIVGAQGMAEQQAAASGHECVAPEACTVCEGTFADADQWLELALDALGPYEYETFQVGTTFPTECEQAERAASAAMGQEAVGETIRTEANRLLAAGIAAATGKQTAPEGRPDVVVDVDTRFWTASARANSIFLAGRYTKSRRDLPQTRWPCRTCHGSGCHACDGTGRMYQDSVEEVLGEPAKAAFDAEDYSFHGAGREDIDALMLGTGRPFVLELHDPKKRTADLAALEAVFHHAAQASGADATRLRMTDKPEVAAIKEATYEKEYLAHCVTDADVTEEAVQDAAAAFTGVTLQQRTPERVAHRRADLIRPRTVQHVTVERFDDARHFSLRVLAESGTYIKEMVSGDDGRTTPNFAAALGVPTVVEFLDVMAILDD